MVIVCVLYSGEFRAARNERIAELMPGCRPNASLWPLSDASLRPARHPINRFEMAPVSGKFGPPQRNEVILRGGGYKRLAHPSRMTYIF